MTSVIRHDQRYSAEQALFGRAGGFSGVFHSSSALAIHLSFGTRIVKKTQTNRGPPISSR